MVTLTRVFLIDIVNLLTFLCYTRKIDISNLFNHYGSLFYVLRLRLFLAERLYPVLYEEKP